MSVEYDDNRKFQALASVLEDYTEWFSHLALHVAYVGEEQISESFTFPASFENWVQDDAVQQEVEQSVLAPVIEVHGRLKSFAVDIVSAVKASQKPHYKDFYEFKNLYSSFLLNLKRLESDGAMKADGTDNLTGLRPAEAIKQDLRKEMERLARSGSPFSLVMLKIDSFNETQNSESALSIVADNIKKTMRPFDDAYYVGDGFYLLSLKHADMVGAEAAIMRVQQSLNIDESNTGSVTISCCMAEPVSGDEITELLKDMKRDLLAHDDTSEAVLKFLEMSPLERFLGTKS